jgi:hypothetical protein
VRMSMSPVIAVSVMSPTTIVLAPVYLIPQLKI